MKKILYIALSLLLSFGMTACNDWLDVNVDPDNPNNSSATVESRLPWIQHYYMYAWGSACMRGVTIGGLMTQTGTTSTNGYLSAWNPNQNATTTSYQNWFIGAACNIDDMIAAAEKIGAYHYIGAAHAIHAMGYMLMTDLYGEMPYSEILGSNPTPVYDNGETIFNGCMARLDKAIEYFNMPQEEGATSLAAGDSWNGGDVQKWLKLCYGLKARWLNKLSKKSALYDPQAVLDALAKAPQSNNDNTIMKHSNAGDQDTNFTVGDPYQTSVIWDCAAWGATQRYTKWYLDLHTNLRGAGVVDPRMSKVFPARMSNIKLNDAGNIVSYKWTRDVGVDVMYGTRRIYGALTSATVATANVAKSYTITNAADKDIILAFFDEEGFPYTIAGDKVSVTYPKGCMYINTNDYKQVMDLKYVNMRALAQSQTGGRAENDMYFYPSASSNAVAGTGSFWTRPDSDSDILTYYEMCFIKAEAYMRQGNTAGAYTAYIDGIKASFARMQTKLQDWAATGTVNPDQQPMNQADINAYMTSGAVAQNAAQLTMSDIMLQKTIAMGVNVETWNDMRRFNYGAGNIGSFGQVYKNYVRPAEFTATNKIPGTDPSQENYWFRRYSQCSHETNYNKTQVEASNPLALTFATGPIWSDPVWWDKAE
ncbi:MAG: SusD/RagB family nutrient-binding outer membrane lipoprotein [Bacteroidales bacterium]|jgi:hypothetical protein|nr:SusD/RagB family nutrient-binding outer membrane lipoprotein [Bacteroidales bacterium]